MPELLAFPNWLFLIVAVLALVIVVRFWRTFVVLAALGGVVGGGYLVFRDDIGRYLQDVQSNAPIVEAVSVVRPTDQVRPTPVSPTAALATLTPIPAADPFAAIDAHALAAPDSAEQSLDALAAYLASGAADESERARAAYRWITAEIDYDAEAFFAGDYGLLTPEEVLAEREAICSGYSRLFQALTERMGLETLEVIGFSKGYTSRIGELDDVNHAWNVVKVDGMWRLVDVTWGAGYLDEQGDFVESFNPHYFFTPPEQFINDHYPEDEQWQLMSVPISAEKFANSPDLSPAFFNYGLELDSHDAAVLSAAERIRVSVQTPADVVMLAAVAQDETRLDRNLTFVQRNGDVTEITAYFPTAGSYELQLFAKQEQEEGEFPYVAGYRVEAGGGSADYRFPQQYATFAETDATLIAPLSGVLERDVEYLFEVSVPGAFDVAIIDGEQWTFMERTGDTFRATTAVINPSIQISAQLDPNSRTYSGLVEYEVAP